MTTGARSRTSGARIPFGPPRGQELRPRFVAGLGSALALATVALASGCYIDTQRHPQPMATSPADLGPGSLEEYPEGPEEVLIVRHSDPVRVRPPGRAQSIPLTFYRKNERANAGAWASCGAGGRMEVLWPSGTSIVLFGEGTGVVGSPSRGEPTFVLKNLSHVTLNLHPEDRVELMGGAILMAESGPFVLEHVREEILRVRNRSKAVGRLAYRDEIFDLDPGHVIDLPLLSAGTGPFQPDPGFQVLGPPGHEIEVRGSVEVVEEDLAEGETRVRATGEHELRAFGTRIRLDPGDEVLFAPVGSGTPPPAQSYGTRDSAGEAEGDAEEDSGAGDSAPEEQGAPDGAGSDGGDTDGE